MIDRYRKNENQYAKVLMLEFEDPEGSWEQEGDDYWRWAKPVYRKPQQSWDSTDGFTRQKIWFAPRAHGNEDTSPDDIEWNDWIQCYWDAQAGRWTVFSTITPSGSIIEFVIDSGSVSGSVSGSASEPDDQLCATRVNDAPASARARVVRRPCGVSRVPGEDDNGFVTVNDTAAGKFLEGRTAKSIEGKAGYAAYLSGEDASGSIMEALAAASISASESDDCVWCILWIDWFIEEQFVRDVIFGEKSITIEKVNAKVWDWCQLPDEIIEGTDCVEDESSASASGSESS